MTIERQSLHAILTTTAASAVLGVVQFAILATVARLVTPADYGVVVGAMVLITPATHILTAGLERAVILHRDVDREAFDAAFAAALVAGLGLSAAVSIAALLLWSAGLLAGFPSVFLMLAPTIWLASGGVVFRAELRRTMAFRRLALADLVAQIVSGAVTVAAAVAGLGPYAIAGGLLTQAALQSGLTWLLAPRSARLRFSVRAFAPIGTIASRLSATSIIEVIHAQLPAAAISGLLGSSAAGLFNRVYVLLQIPLELPVSAATRVLFSTFGRQREDRAALRRSFGNLVCLASTGIAAFGSGAVAAAPELVAVFLGPQWVGGVALVPWLGVGAGAAMLGHLFAVLNEAAMQFERRVRIQAATTVLLGVSLAAGATVGLTAMAMAFAACSVLFLALQVRLARDVLEVSWMRVLGWMAPAAVAGVACTAWVMTASAWMPEADTGWRLLIQVAGCAVVLAIHLVFVAQWLRRSADVAPAVPASP